MCRTRAIAIVTYDPLELVSLPKAELDAMRAPALVRQRLRNRAASSGKPASAGDEAQSPCDGDFTAVESIFVAGGSMSASGVDEQETEICWVARVNGPGSGILDYLTEEDIARTTWRP